MSKRVYVGRLSSQARQSDVEKFFRGFGSIREVLMKRGYCFVEFDSSKDAEEAVHDMNGKTICGDKVIVEMAKSKPYNGKNSRRRQSRSRSPHERKRSSRRRSSSSSSSSNSPPQKRRDERSEIISVSPISKNNVKIEKRKPKSPSGSPESSESNSTV